jgi:catalase
LWDTESSSSANFLRDGAMNFNNQGKRPNFWSQQDLLPLAPRPYNDDNHTIWTGGAVKYLSTPTELDFDLPRIFVRSEYHYAQFAFESLIEP